MFRPSRALGEEKYNADDIMMSVLSTLQAQLMPRITVANCCSGFHQMFNDFLSEGCGAATEHNYQCLQDTDDPLLFPCCGYNDQCVEKKKQALLEIEQRENKDATDGVVGSITG